MRKEMENISLNVSSKVDLLETINFILPKISSNETKITFEILNTAKKLAFCIYCNKGGKDWIKFNLKLEDAINIDKYGDIGELREVLNNLQEYGIIS